MPLLAVLLDSPVGRWLRPPRRRRRLPPATREKHPGIPAPASAAGLPANAAQRAGRPPSRPVLSAARAAEAPPNPARVAGEYKRSALTAAVVASSVVYSPCDGTCQVGEGAELTRGVVQRRFQEPPLEATAALRECRRPAWADVAHWCWPDIKRCQRRYGGRRHDGRGAACDRPSELDLKRLHECLQWHGGNVSDHDERMLMEYLSSSPFQSHKIVCASWRCVMSLAGPALVLLVAAVRGGEE